jgi:transposase InsO family protein
MLIFWGPMDGNYYFILIDPYSKWPKVFKMKDIRIKTTTNKLRETFARYSLATTIVSDNGPQFTVQKFDKYIKRHQIKHVKTPVYHPQSNGQAENFVNAFKQVQIGHCYLCHDKSMSC